MGTGKRGVQLKVNGTKTHGALSAKGYLFRCDELFPEVLAHGRRRTGVIIKNGFRVE
jgi:hypothetical protein